MIINRVCSSDQVSLVLMLLLLPLPHLAHSIQVPGRGRSRAVCLSEAFSLSLPFSDAPRSERTAQEHR